MLSGTSVHCFLCQSCSVQIDSNSSIYGWHGITSALQPQVRTCQRQQLQRCSDSPSNQVGIQERKPPFPALPRGCCKTHKMWAHRPCQPERQNHLLAVCHLLLDFTVYTNYLLDGKILVRDQQPHLRGRLLQLLQVSQGSDPPPAQCEECCPWTVMLKRLAFISAGNTVKSL